MIFPEAIAAATEKLVVNNNSVRYVPHSEMCDWHTGDTKDFKNVMLETIT